MITYEDMDMGQPKGRYQVDLEEAVRQYADMIYRIAMTITGNRQDADDVFQETFLRLAHLLLSDGKAVFRTDYNLMMRLFTA